MCAYRGGLGEKKVHFFGGPSGWNVAAFAALVRAE